jgi:hypothetical protein
LSQFCIRIMNRDPPMTDVELQPALPVSVLESGRLSSVNVVSGG